MPMKKKKKNPILLLDELEKLYKQQHLYFGE
jgi:hypothetical protein